MNPKRLHALFEYQHGLLITKTARGSQRKGSQAGWPHSQGYLGVTVDYKSCYVHRVIWTLLCGKIPKGMCIDHINGNKRDNCIENLRLVTHQENLFNQPASRGYSWHKKSQKWKARIMISGRDIHLGLFQKQSDARRAYLLAKKKFHSITPRASNKNWENPDQDEQPPE